jgi:chemotaxis protein CheY-P-specific phosphatase CheC
MSQNDLPPASLLKVMRDAASRAAGALGEILSCSVSMQLDHIRLLDASDIELLLKSEADTAITLVQLGFHGDITGIGYFLLPGNDQEIIHILADQDPNLIHDENSQQSVISEIGNVVLNMYIGTVVNQMAAHIVFDPPKIMFRVKLDTIPVPDIIRTENLDRKMMTSRLSFAGNEVTVYILLVFTEPG